MKKFNKYLIPIVLVFVAVLSFYYYEEYSNFTISPSKVVVSSSTPSYFMSDVVNHNSTNSCWTVVRGYVYDITKFIPNHPGGKEIVKACGKDGTALFMGEREHAEQNAQSTLDSYFIGTLKK